MQNKRRAAGFTLIELLTVLAIIGILCAIAIPSCTSITRGSAQHAKSELATFAGELGWKVEGTSCAGIDSNNDGYISCTARVREDDRIVDKAVECASGGWFQWTSGCKLAIPQAYPAQK